MLHVRGASEGVRGRSESPRNWACAYVGFPLHRYGRSRKPGRFSVCALHSVRCRTERRSFASLHSLFPASAGGHFFPALSMICPRKKEQGNYVVSLLFFCAAPESSLARRVGRCPTPCKGSALDPLGRCPRPRKGSALDPPGLPRPGPRNSLRGLVYDFVQPRRITIFFPSLRCLRRSWVQGHAPAAQLYQHLRDLLHRLRTAVFIPSVEVVSTRA